MRAVTLTLVATILVAGAFAAGHAGTMHTCQTIANGALYTSASACTDYTACGTTYCSCVGQSGSVPATCMRAVTNATTCSTVQTCMAAYTRCISRVSSTAQGCSTLATSLRVQHMSTTAATYANSTLQRSCRNRVCAIMNTSSLHCNFGSMDMNVCFFRPLATSAPMTNASMTTAPAATTRAPGPSATSAAPENFRAALRVTISIKGSAFDQIEADAAAWTNLGNAIKTDLGTYLEVDTRFLHIFRMWVASLEVDFGVDAAAGVQPSVLATKMQNANTGLQLTSVQNVYSGFSNETLSVEVILSTLVTLAPGEVTPMPPPGSISASAGVMTAAAAALAAVAAVLAF